jgi:hypothetical protein
MDAVYIDDVFEMYDMIFSLSIDRNVALLNATAQSFDNVTFLIDENGGMIPASEYFVRTPITERFAKTNHAASPAGAVGKDEVAGARVDHLLARRKALNRSGMCPAAPGPATSSASTSVHYSFESCYASSRSVSLAVFDCTLE